MVRQSVWEVRAVLRLPSTSAQCLLYEFHGPECGRQALPFITEVAKGSGDHGWRDQAVEFGTSGAVSLPGTLDRASQDVAGNECENNRVLSHGGIMAVLRKKVHQPGCGRGFPSFGPRRLDVRRPPARHRPRPSSIHHEDMIRTRVLVARVPRLPVDAYASSPGGDAAVKCSNRIVRHRPLKPMLDRLTCADDLYRPSWH